MKVVYFECFCELLCVVIFFDLELGVDGVVVKIEVIGFCCFDWYGWMGYDSDIVLFYVLGYEFVGIVVVIGCNVLCWKKGDCVIVFFVFGCGCCVECVFGN